MKERKFMSLALKRFTIKKPIPKHKKRAAMSLRAVRSPKRNELRLCL